MASLIRVWGLALTASGLLAGCSPEANRVRDGGPGGDPGNKIVIAAPAVNPRAADTTLWPGRAPTPVEQLVAGTMPPPPSPLPTSAAPAKDAPSGAEQRAFTESAPDPRTGPERR